MYIYVYIYILRIGKPQSAAAITSGTSVSFENLNSDIVKEDMGEKWSNFIHMKFIYKQRNSSIYIYIDIIVYLQYMQCIYMYIHTVCTYSNIMISHRSRLLTSFIHFAFDGCAEELCGTVGELKSARIDTKGGRSQVSIFAHFVLPPRIDTSFLTSYWHFFSHFVLSPRIDTFFSLRIVTMYWHFFFSLRIVTSYWHFFFSLCIDSGFFSHFYVLQGRATVVFARRSDAITAIKKFNGKHTEISIIILILFIIMLCVHVYTSDNFSLCRAHFGRLSDGC